MDLLKCQMVHCYAFNPVLILNLSVFSVSLHVVPECAFPVQVCSVVWNWNFLNLCKITHDKRQNNNDIPFITYITFNVLKKSDRIKMQDRQSRSSLFRSKCQHSPCKDLENFSNLLLLYDDIQSVQYVYCDINLPCCLFQALRSQPSCVFQSVCVSVQETNVVCEKTPPRMNHPFSLFFVVICSVPWWYPVQFCALLFKIIFKLIVFF